MILLEKANQTLRAILERTPEIVLCDDGYHQGGTTRDRAQRRRNNSEHYEFEGTEKKNILLMFSRESVIYISEENKD